MTQPPVDATITIVSFNTREKLADCLQSVFDTTPGLRLEVIVIDNGSRDGSVEMVRERFPQVTVIATGQNLGFGRAHNLGMRQAGGRYLIVLNPDTLLLERTIQRQLEFMDSAPDAGACGCTVLDATRALAPSGHRDFTLLSLAANVFNLRAVLPRDEWLRRRAGRWLGRVHGAYHPHDAVRRVDWVLERGGTLVLELAGQDLAGARVVVYAGRDSVPHRFQTAEDLADFRYVVMPLPPGQYDGIRLDIEPRPGLSHSQSRDGLFVVRAGRLELRSVAVYPVEASGSESSASGMTGSRKP